MKLRFSLSQANFHKNAKKYLEAVKTQSEIPVMMGFGIRIAKDIAAYKNTIDGCIVGSHFIQLMKESNYDRNIIRNYISTFKAEINQ